MRFSRSGDRARAAFTLLAIGPLVVIAACGTGAMTVPPRPAAMPPGCGRSGPVVLAVGGHANTPAPALSTSMATAVDDAAAMDDAAPIGVVSIEGTPRLGRVL
ncbi:hypothetical protein ACWDSJ_15535 [Nocardia sp. NPDC003482]